MIFLYLDPLLLKHFVQFVIGYQELVGVNSSEALEAFGPPFASSLIVLTGYVSLPFLMSMFMLAPLRIIASTKSTKG
jgi:hypothetical protein